jgi:hypothetical protein
MTCVARTMLRDFVVVRWVRQTLRRSGAVSLRRLGEGFEIARGRATGYDRPWAPAARQPDGSRRQARRGRAVRNRATPLHGQRDLEPGD